MSRIIVFGATGGTGMLVVAQALKAGHLVAVIVRKPETFLLQHNNLQIIKGDVFNPYTFQDYLKDADVIVSCLGIQKREPTTVYSQGVMNILQAMKYNHINRIICLSAGAVIVPPKGTAFTRFMIKNILQKVFKYLYSDMLIMEKILKESDINFTIIRPPWLRNTKYTGKYRVVINQHLEKPTKIARADLADFIVNHLNDKNIFRATVELSY